MLDFRDTWAILRVRPSRGHIRIDYSDGFHHRAGPFELPTSDAISLPHEVTERIAQLVQSVPDSRPGIRNDGPISVPIFVRTTGPDASPLPWSQLIRSLRFAGIPGDRLQFVHLTHWTLRVRPPFRLPFNVLTMGSTLRFGLGPLLQRSWLATDPLIQERGVSIHETNRVQLRGRLEETRQDVLFLSELHSTYVYRVIANLSAGYRPRLIVDGSHAVRAVPEGVSVLHAPDESAAGSLGTEIIFGLIHDLPLHEILGALTRKFRLAREFSLYSNPVANHDLRILDAYRDLHKKMIVFQSLTTGFEPQALEMIGTQAPALRGVIEAYSPKALAVGASATGAVQQVASFSHESTGLLPLVKAQIQLLSAQRNWKNLEFQLRKIHVDVSAIRFLTRRQHRTVDVALERLETQPYVSTVSPRTSIQVGARYQVRIHVGNTLPGNLMKQQPPPLDPLLPHSKLSAGHNLAVAIQEKEFHLLSANRKRLFLPRYGASKQVYFAVRAPLQHGPASLRILVYYGNQLLQAFLLRTTVNTTEEEHAEGTTQVELEFSQTTRFTNLHELGPRALSVVANDNLDGTHEFYLFGKSVGQAALGDPAYVNAMEQIRAILTEASLMPGTTKERSFPQTPHGASASPVAVEFLRRLADKGREIYTGMFSDLSQGTPLPEAIRSLRDTEGETIQIIRLQKRLVIPWSLLYDYELPDKRQGDVCLGLTKDNTGSVRSCSHGPNDKVYCIKGFWGVRHVVEERITNGSNDDAVQSIPIPANAEPLCVAMDITVNGVPALHQQLKDGVGEKKVFGPVDATHLLDLLWQEPPKRPTVLVVLGHLETRPPKLPPEPAGDRIVLVQNTSWLTHQSISDRYMRLGKHWEQPRPLVLLMACSVAATTVAKLNDFVIALNNAGAGAIVGTECLVFAGLVCSFARKLTLEMWKADQNGQHVSLGRAMRQYRIETLQSGNPLAFVFRSIGNADLILET